MIEPADEAVLPSGITVDERSLRDHVLQRSYPINATAALLLRHLNRRRQIGAVASTVSAGTGVSREVLERDLVSFVARLNEAHLINVRPWGISGRFRRAWYVGLHLLLIRTIPTLFVTRHTVSNSNCLALVTSVSAALIRELLPIWMTPAFGLFALGVALRSPLLLIPALAVVPAFASLVVHEIGHAVAVRAARGRSYLITAGCQAGIVHSLAGSQPLVHAAGASFAGGVGVVIVCWAYFTGSGLLAAVALPFLLSWGGLTVVSKDGRSLATSLSTGR